MKFEHTTLPELRREIRDRFRSESGVRRLKAAQWLAANCTNVQLQSVFGLATLAEAVALRTRLQAKTAKLSALRAAETDVQNQAGE